MNLSKSGTFVRGLLLLATATGLSSSLFAQAPLRSFEIPGSQLAVGCWFGRAIPIPGQVVCVPGSAGCAVPNEIIMVFTINADGTFIGIDSNIFKGGTHSTAHGQWVSRSYGTVNATFTLLQEGPNGIFIGGFKNLFEATLSDENNMTGQIHAYLYSYTDANGNAIVGANGLPTPSPLTPPSACTPPGCVFLGSFSFIAQRVNVEN